MNTPVKECAKCEYLEIVSGGGWRHNEEPCAKSSSTSVKHGGKPTLSEVLSDIDWVCLHNGNNHEEAVREVLSKYFTN